MKFKLKPHSKNLYPKGAVLIEDTSPRIWLEEIQKMGFDLNEIRVYAVPSLVANQLYGCFLVYKTGLKIKDIGKNRHFQNVKDKLFLPENTLLSPAFSEEEWEVVFRDHPYVYHLDFGLVELKEEVDWMAIMGPFTEEFPLLSMPSKSTAIPRRITSLRIEADEEKILKQLENPISEEEMIEDLPFDMKKVLKGNQKEIDKYLTFLDKNPNMALQYAIPLDVLNTSRESLNGKFVFSRSSGRNISSWFKMPRFLKSLGTGSATSSRDSEPWISSDTAKMVLRIFILLLIVGRGFSLPSGVFIGFIKVLLYGSIAMGVLYLIYKFIKKREAQRDDRLWSDHPHPSKGSYNAGSGHYGQSGSPNTSYRPYADDYRPSPSSHMDPFKFLPLVVVAVIVGMSILFVKNVNNMALSGVSPLVCILVFFGLIIIVIFIIVKVFDLIDKALKNRSSGSGGSMLLDSDRFSSLRGRYEKLAEDFIADKKYEKAAHIYRRLLKDNYRAAQVLEEGKLYQEAAVMYLKFCQNKEKAAECYEKGRCYKEAIALYKELDQNEKVGDLYLLLAETKEANKHFYKVVEGYKEHSQYVKASLLLRNKVKAASEAQEMLLDGWRTNKDAANCLNNYFVNVEELQQLKDEIRTIYENETNVQNLEVFLQVLKIEFKKDEGLEEVTKDIAYEIIADRIENRPDISSELMHFNRSNPSISKDISRFKLNSKKRND